MQHAQLQQIGYTQRLKELRPLIEQMQSDNHLPHHPNALLLWQRLQDGILPFAGGWLEQPAWYTEDMSYIALLSEFEALPHLMKKNAKHIQDLAKSNGR